MQHQSIELVKKGLLRVVQQYQKRLLASSSLSEHQKKLMARGLPKQRSLEGVQRIVCVASGKGGVGKSTVAVNLACILANEFRLKVGLLDADIYGPSIPKMMDLDGHSPEFDAEKKDEMLPIQNYNVGCMSMGFLVDQKTPMVWRGLMVMQAVERLMFKVKWAPLDILVIDMPPGTGDVQLSISQHLKLNGAIVVSTPQDIALLDARRGIEMFTKVDVPILGLVQNMSAFVCTNCGHEHHLFGKEGVQRLADEYKCDVLCDVPLNVLVRETCDQGQPACLDAQNPVFPHFKLMATKLLDKLSLKL